MKTKLILKSLSDLPSPAPDTAATGYLSAMPAIHIYSTEPTMPSRGRWDPKDPTTNSLVNAFGRMAPAHLHVN